MTQAGIGLRCRCSPWASTACPKCTKKATHPMSVPAGRLSPSQAESLGKMGHRLIL